MDWKTHIHTDPAILIGKPVLRGTRISVEFLLDLMAGGWTEEMILDGFPHLTRDGIRAAVQFAADMVSGEPETARRRAA